MSHLHTCHQTHNVKEATAPGPLLEFECIGPRLEFDNVELSIPVPGVAIVAVTDGLHGLVIKVASLGVAVATGPGARTQTLSAGNLVLSKLRSSVVTNLRY